MPNQADLRPDPIDALGSLDDEFVGDRGAPWPVAVQALVEQRVVAPESTVMASLLHAYGLLIGNTDMHAGNLSFLGEPGRPLTLAPAYDMLPMGFAPTAGGALRSELPALALPSCVPHPTWRQALGRISKDFRACLVAIQQRQDQARAQIERLA